MLLIVLYQLSHVWLVDVSWNAFQILSCKVVRKAEIKRRIQFDLIHAYLVFNASRLDGVGCAEVVPLSLTIANIVDSRIGAILLLWDNAVLLELVRLLRRLAATVLSSAEASGPRIAPLPEIAGGELGLLIQEAVARLGELDFGGCRSRPLGYQRIQNQVTVCDLLNLLIFLRNWYSSAH